MIDHHSAPAPAVRRVLSCAAWASLPLLSVGMLSCLPFAWLAVRSQTPWKWGSIALGYFALTVAWLVYIPESAAGLALNAWDALPLAVWIASTVHTFVAYLDRRDGCPTTYRNRLALKSARAREARRCQARALLESSPGTARDLRTGRPDLERVYDDGGLVDLNAVAASVMVDELGWTSAEAEHLVAVRDRLGRFDGPTEVIALTELAPARIDTVRSLLAFSP